MHIDPKKVVAMQQWPLPKDIKSIRGFLGLTRYYKKFFKGHGTIVAPLIALLKKDSFCWSKEAELAFHQLREARSNHLY